jgi:hypothetical protein
MPAMRPTSHARRRAVSRLRLGLGTALTVCAALPFAAPAHAAELLVAPGSGMTLPKGIAETTNGSLWVADQALGVCRVQTAVPALVASPYCQPEAAELAAPRPGPSTPHQMAFDPVSSNFFVAEGDSKGSGVWRLHWNADTDSIDSAEKVVNAGGNRVFALAMGRNADGSVYVDFNGRDDATIRRLDDAAAAPPVGIAATPVVGIANARAVPSMANLNGALYLAEAGGVTRIATPGAGVPVAEPVPGFPAAAGSVPNALVADRVNARVYVGTANVDGLDRVDVLTPGDAVTTYETGFALVSGMAVRTGGALLVADDPPASAGAPESLGQSRLWELPLRAADLPTVAITGGPEPYSSATSVTFNFSSSSGAPFRCRLDGAAWAPCDSADGTTGSHSLSGLRDAVHVFEVRAGDGQPARQTFVVDTIAPVAQVDNPASDKVFVGDALRMRFSANEFGVTYRCELDGRALYACEPPKWLRGFDVGEHLFAVTPTDLAGNIGATVRWSFERLAPPPPPPPAEQHGDPVPAAPAASVAGPAVVAASGSSVAASCRALAPKWRGRFALNGKGRGRLLTARIAPPGGARYVKLTLRSRRGFAQSIAARRVAGVRFRDVRVVLTPAQAARLRMRGSTVTAAFGTCSSTLGRPGALAPATTRTRAR